MAKRKINYEKIQVSEKYQPTLEALSEVDPFFCNLDENLHLIQYEIANYHLSVYNKYRCAGDLLEWKFQESSSGRSGL